MASEKANEPKESQECKESFNKFGIRHSNWQKVTAEEMLTKYPNNLYRFCSQKEWLNEYWKKRGFTTDEQKAWNVPIESDELNWNLGMWGSYLD